MTRVRLAVVVPLGPGDRPRAGLLERLRAGSAWFALQAILAAGGELPAAEAEALARAGWEVRRGAGPRGTRLRASALASAGAVFWFVHADTLPPRGWAGAMAQALDRGADWGAFRHGFDGARHRWISWGADLRSRLLGLPLGDQAPFARRSAYEAAGGHPDWPLFDDYELARRLRRRARPIVLAERVETSPRRFERLGPLRTVLRNRALMLRFRLGARPEDLARRYRR